MKLYPLFFRWLNNLHRHWPGAFRYCMGQYTLWLGSWSFFLWLDWQKALIFIIVPQLHGLHWLLATNYLQHAHADGRPLTRGQRLDSATPLNYARNFEGWVNPLLFNIGLHTAHHERPQAHWSELTRLHSEHYRQRVAPALNEGGLLPYMARVFVLGQNRDTAPRGRRHLDHHIERVVRSAFKLARQRRGYLVSVDKANVLETSRL